MGQSVRLLDTAIDLCADEGPRRRALAEQLLWAAWWADDPLRADRMRLLDRIAPALTGGTDAERLLITPQAWSLVLALALRHSAPAEAREIAATAHEQADRFTDPATRGRALRVPAALNDGTEHLAESARLLRDAPSRWHYLQSLARSGHTADARRTLGEALVLADECGAIALREVIARRLTATGATPARPRRSNALSPRLRRVAQLTAEGRSEAEIAHGMLLSLEVVRTLVQEAHTRLSTTSRAELRAALATEPPAKPHIALAH